MEESSHSDRNNKDFYLVQYNRLAEDWRHISSLIWQIPSIAVAITGAIVGISFEFLEGIPRILLLFLGSLFLFTLSIALAKYRLFHDSRAQWLHDLENEFNIKKMPLTTEETDIYLKEKRKTTNPLYNLLYKKKSFIWLLYVIFISSLMMGLLSIYSIIQFSFPLENEDNKTNLPIDDGITNSNNIEYISQILAHPFVLTLIGLVFSSLLIPKITQEWRKPKEFEIRMKLIDRINESIAGILTAVYLDQVSEMSNDAEYRNSQITWEKEKEVISSNIRAIFPESQIIDDWNKLSLFITEFHSLNLFNDENKRRELLNTMKKTIDFSEDIEILVKRDKYEPEKGDSSELYMKSWIELKTEILNHKDEIINRILKIKRISVR